MNTQTEEITEIAEQSILDFHAYPSVGSDDWRYAFQTAQVRVLETQMLSRAVLSDMANAENYEAAVSLLSATEYAMPRAGHNFAELENILRLRRTELRQLFADLILDELIVELFSNRDDFANLRLALRRTLTQKPPGADYSNDGNVPADLFQKALEEENYDTLPDYMQHAIEQAVLAYYQDKDIRRIDYAIDRTQAEFNLRKAHQLKNTFLIALFRIQIDLANIRTMLRLKFTESEQESELATAERNVFLKGGYVTLEPLQRAPDLGYESHGQLFFHLPYHRLVETAAGYLASDKSFLKAEQQCEQFLTGFLNSTVQITAGPQPIIAYLLNKENEIRTVRLILTAKKSSLDTKLILDRIT
ncbi:MAG: V-type ATPase subunit [Planctomycetota bacterium]|nr:MAG: V-type ATPase subunit [Planctomycetota bacterium]